MRRARRALWLLGALIFVAAVALGAWQIARDEVPIVTLLGLIALLLGVLVTWQARWRERARLELDAAMQAGTLLAMPDRPAANTSALLALTKAGRADLAVALLVDLWSGERQQVSTETAILVVDAALRSSDEAQLVAAELLRRNATRLDSGQSLHWPSSIDGSWDPQLAPKAKFLVLEALLSMATAQPLNRESLSSLAVRLHAIWAHEPDASVRGFAGTAIEVLVPALERLGYRNLSIVTLEQLRAATGGRPNRDQFLAEVVATHRARLAEWVAASEVPLGRPVKAVTG